ncbi:hypothetical protein [Hyalangium gracile]|uniref:hypothetical protein n=1 Tax=Hyalangium gracile TaxID=394092 RepID=UPI001CCD353A|nr:hypothetical protein [Hyalangium gracile]
MSGPGLNLPKSDPRYHALSLVRAPAFLLLCVGSLNLILCVILLGMAGFKVLTDDQPFSMMGFTAAEFLLPAAAAIVCGVLSVWGAMSALSLRSYGLVIVGAITASFCLSPTVCVGIPATCWTLFILSNPEVKKAFLP